MSNRKQDKDHKPRVPILNIDYAALELQTIAAILKPLIDAQREYADAQIALARQGQNRACEALNRGIKAAASTLERFCERGQAEIDELLDCAKRSRELHEQRKSEYGE